MKLNKPARLQNGDTVAVVAPSMFSTDEKAISRGIERLQDVGLNVKKGNTLKLSKNYMAGSDEERARDLMRMFLDPDVKGIICLMGGSVSNRILERLDYKIIGENPKIFTGMSDITNLHLAFLSRANMVSLHQIDLLFHFGGKKGNPAIDYSIDLFSNVTRIPKPLGKIPPYGEWETWRHGLCEGRLVGGWLPAIASLVNTKYWPRFHKIILFWEAINLEIHEISRILMGLRLSGVFQNVCGMMVGQTPHCEEKEYKGLEPTIREIVTEITKPYDFPIMGNVDFGHANQNIPLPEGIRARMDASNLSISLIESMVREKC